MDEHTEGTRIRGVLNLYLETYNEVIIMYQYYTFIILLSESSRIDTYSFKTFEIWCLYAAKIVEILS